MVLSLLASLCIQTSTIDLPPGYYVADDFAMILSTKEHRIHVSDELSNRLYAARIHECSREDFIKMLEDRLRLRFVERNGETFLEEKPEEKDRFTRFREQLGRRLDKYISKLCTEADKAMPAASSAYRRNNFLGEVKSPPSEGRNWVFSSQAFFPYASMVWLRKNGASRLLSNDQIEDIPYGSVVNGRAYSSKVRDYYRLVWPQIDEKQSFGYLDAVKLYRSIVAGTVLKQSISFDPRDMSISIVEKLDGGEYGSLTANSKIGIPKSLLKGLDGDEPEVDLAPLANKFGVDWGAFMSDTTYTSQLLMKWASDKDVNLIAEVSLVHDYQYGSPSVERIFKPLKIGNQYSFSVGFADRDKNRVTRCMIPKLVGNVLVVRNSTLVWESMRKHPIQLIKNRLARPSPVDGHLSFGSLLDLVSRFSGNEIVALEEYQLNWPQPQLAGSLKLLKVLSLLSQSDRDRISEKLLQGDSVLIGINGLQPHSKKPISQVIVDAFDQTSQSGPTNISLNVDISGKTYFILHADATEDTGIYRILALFNNEPSMKTKVDKDQEYRRFWDLYPWGQYDFLQFRARL